MPCACESGPAPCCWDRHPWEDTWIRCTLPEGHEGEHVYCGGQGDAVAHRMFVWPR